MGKAIGIDLGTTNTAVAVLVDGRPRVLEDEKGYKVLPSCVSLKPDGRFIVGQAARNLVITDPERTCFAVKRLMGRRFDSAECTHVRERMAYEIIEAPDGLSEVRLVDQTFSPVEVSALILQVAKSIAERAIDEEVDEAVITVPAYFNHAQRAATLEAARLAGLRCERLLNEPTAAALAYGFRKHGEKTIVIYDLGGGTFDVSVLHINQGVYEILATKGDTFLGGEDFDFRLVDHLADHFQHAHSADLRNDVAALQRVKDAAERAKCELSFTDRTTVLVPRLSGDLSLEHSVSRLTLEGLVEDLVERTLEVTRQAVREAGLNLADVDDVILVGGQTRMPRVREAISGLFGRQPSRGVHPEEVVAIGAAVHASSLTDTEVPGPLLLDVTPFDLGIDVAGGLFQPIIARNNHVPAAASRLFATSADNQESVVVRVRQGESRFASENEFLGEFVLSGLTAAPRMQTKVEVTFRIDMNGMLHCSAMEPATGERREIVVRNYAEYAKDGGELEITSEGGRSSAAASTAAPPVGLDDAIPPRAPAAKAASGGGGGLLGRFFGRKSSSKAKAPKAAGPTPAPTPVPPAADPGLPPQELSGAELEELPELDADALQPAIMMPNLSSGPVIEAPAGEVDPDELEDLTDLEELEELDELEDIEEIAGVLLEEAGDSPASIGIAGGGVSGWRPEEEDLERGRLSYRDASPLPLVGEDDDLLASLPDDLADAFGTSDDLADAFSSTDDDPFSGEDLGDAFSLPPDEDTEEVERREPQFPVEDDVTNIFGQEVPRSGMGEDEDVRDEVEDLLAALRADGVGDQLPEEPLFGLPPAPGPVKPPAPPPRRRKPARLKLAYRRAESMVDEYRENLRRGGCFVKTKKPLPVGRECNIEVRAPGLEEPLRLNGVVTWSSADQPSLPPGQDPGMGIEYRLDDRGRQDIETVLARLVG